jgi:(R)-2-hydroxyacyl-CoA dehydratese activating ATPase
MICAGLDAGSRAIKVVLFDHARGKIVASGVSDQGVRQPELAEALYAETLRDAGLSPGDIHAVVATGYGRNRVRFAGTTITEITCHARGVHYLAPEARSIVEIGGQDSKIIRLEDGGRVRDFAMNDRCAAGTGRFLEMLAARLQTNFAALDEFGRQSLKPAVISNTCVVFAETEIIGLLAEGCAASDIVAGVQQSVAMRVAAMAGRGLETPVIFTGGVALQAGMLRALETVLGSPIRIPPQPQFSGALGAAILAGRPAAGSALA